MLHLLVDAYNLLYALKDLGKLNVAKSPPILNLEEKRNILISKLQEYQSVREVHISLIFDSSDPSSIMPQRSRAGGINIIFTDEAKTADEYILKLCQESPGGYVVVSNDREVQSFAKINDCLSMGCEEFIQKLATASNELFKDPYLEDKEDSGPLYPRVSTKKKGAARKLSKSERRKKNSLKNL